MKAALKSTLYEHMILDCLESPQSYFPQAQCIKNLGNVLEAAGSSWEKVVKVNVYLKDMGNFSAMNEVYEKVRMEMSKKIKYWRSHLFLEIVTAISKTCQNLHSSCKTSKRCRC